MMSGLVLLASVGCAWNLVLLASVGCARNVDMNFIR